MNLLAFFDLYPKEYLGLDTHQFVLDQEFQYQLKLLLHIPHLHFVMHLQKLQKYIKHIRITQEQ
jgi:hypothetical protein